MVNPKMAHDLSNHRYEECKVDEFLEEGSPMLENQAEVRKEHLTEFRNKKHYLHDKHYRIEKKLDLWKETMDNIAKV